VFSVRYTLRSETVLTLKTVRYKLRLKKAVKYGALNVIEHV